MKKFIIVLCLFSGYWALGQKTTEQEVKTDVTDVTVFTDGCQIVRRKAVDLPQGTVLLKFTGLSPFLDAKSVQVKTDGDLTVLSVNHQSNYLKNSDSVRNKKIVDDIKGLNDKIEVEEAYKATLEEDLNFLSLNRKIGGDNQTVTVQQLRDAGNYFNERSDAIRMKLIERNKAIVRLKEEKGKLEQQLNADGNKKQFPQGEVWVKIENPKAGRSNFELTYLAANAGWMPNYDIIARTIEQPIQLVYKANIYQNTQEDWKNVKLRLSSANPNSSGLAPELKTYFVGYGYAPPKYNAEKGTNVNALRGNISDTKGEPIPGATIKLAGTTIGTITDINGNYALTLPYNISSGNSTLLVSGTGMKPQEVTIGNRSVINVALEENIQHTEEAVVVAYGVQRKGNVATALSGKVAGVSVSKKNKEGYFMSDMSTTAPVAAEFKGNQTAFEYEVKMPYSIPFDGKSYTVAIDEYEVSAQYEYYCAPKADRAVFLKAFIVDWEKYNLLEGEASLFFENTYIGKTLLDTRTANDTLSLSLGRDKSITVTREIQKNFSSKSFLGTKKEETRAWKITVKNNKTSAISLQLVDQIPVSNSSDFEVKALNLSGGKQDNETGKITWNITLSPKQSKEIELRYSVKSPKSYYQPVE